MRWAVTGKRVEKVGLEVRVERLLKDGMIPKIIQRMRSDRDGYEERWG